MGRKISFLIAIMVVLALITYPAFSAAEKPPKPDKPTNGQAGGNNGNHGNGNNGNGNGGGDTTPDGEPSTPEGTTNQYGNGPSYVPNNCSWQAGDSHVGHLYLYQQNPETGEIVEQGAWGKVRYNLYDVTFKFVFNGHKLVPGQEYSLVYLPEPVPGEGLICLGSGIANRGGNLHIMNMQAGVDTCDLPAEADANFPDGALIALIPSEDVVCDEGLVGWYPEEYLFGCDFITFADLDGCGEESPDIVIEKATNGEDADTPTGPVIPVGDPVEWTYEVTNTGTEVLSNVVVSDNKGVVVSCPATELLPGESMVCVAGGVAVEGQYGNVGIVIATKPDGSEVGDSDRSHYFGVLDPAE